MRTSSARTPNYRQDASRRTVALATFRQQMADFARAEKLRQLREERHLTQDQAAYEIGVTPKSLRAWEKGSGIRWHNAKRLGEYYGVPAESLVRQEEDRGAPDLSVIHGNGEGEPDQLAEINEKLDKVIAFLGLDGAAQQQTTIQDLLVAMVKQAAAESQPSERPARS